MQNEQFDNVNSTVEYLSKAIPAAHESASCMHILELFHDDKKLYAIPVINDQHRPVGIVVRQDYTEHFSKQYVKELTGRKSITSMMNASPIVVDCNTGIDDIARIVLDAGIEHLVSGFIITKDEQYMGMANGYDLLKEMTRRKQKHLFGLAHFDQLTGLPNRTLLLDRLKQAISASSRASRVISLLFIDLDGFKPVNDRYGHATGDHLLKEVAARLRTCIREGDTAARLGGDEFVVLLLESDQDTASVVANRILAVLREGYQFGQQSISTISASIGIAQYPHHAGELDALLLAADHAMYVAKKSGKDCCAVFSPSAD